MVHSEVNIQQFGATTVYDESEEAILLSTLWQKETAVLVFVRHFGWVICRQQVAELAQFQSEFMQDGGKLVVIGSGKVKDLSSFRKVTDYGGILLTDPSRESYNVLGFKSGLTDLIGMASFGQTFSALKAGFLPGSIQGYALQLGGAIIVAPGGDIKYLFKSSVAGDHPPKEDLLAAIK